MDSSSGWAVISSHMSWSAVMVVSLSLFTVKLRQISWFYVLLSYISTYLSLICGAWMLDGHLYPKMVESKTIVTQISQHLGSR
eukprot:scaffold5181_cov148-Skeletonema_menzelii.AAC.12